MRTGRKVSKSRWKVLFLLVVFIGMLGREMTAFATEGREGFVTEISGQAEVTSDVNVRKGPGTNYDIIGTVRTGEVLPVTGKTGDGWYLVTYQSESGYVYGKYLSVTEQEATPVEEQAPVENQDQPIEQEKEASGNSIVKPIAILVMMIVIAVMMILTIRSMRQPGETDADDDSDEEASDYDDEDDYDEEASDYDDEDDYDEEASDYDDEDDYDEEASDYDDEDNYDEEASDYDNEDDYDGEAAEYDGEDSVYDEEASDENDRDYEKETDVNNRIGADRNLGGVTGKKRDRSTEPKEKRTEGKKQENAKEEFILREEDYQLHIDPKYFEDDPVPQPDCVTGYLLKKEEEETAKLLEEQKKQGNAADIDRAMNKLQELQEELERLKRNQ